MPSHCIRLHAFSFRPASEAQVEKVGKYTLACTGTVHAGVCLSVPAVITMLWLLQFHFMLKFIHPF